MWVFKEQFYVYILLQYLQNLKCGLLLALKSRAYNRKGCFYEYRNILLSQGYTCIRYKNTAPMEIKGVSDKTCYVVLDPSIIKITGVREIEIH